MLSHALCFPFRLYEEGSPSPCTKYVLLEGEKREQTGDFIQDTIFHQVLLMLQAIASGNSLSQSISYFCFPYRCPSAVVPRQGGVGHLPSAHTHQPHMLTEGFPAHPGGKGRLVATSRDMPEDCAWVSLLPCTPETCSM